MNPSFTPGHVDLFRRQFALLAPRPIGRPILAFAAMLVPEPYWLTNMRPGSLTSHRPRRLLPAPVLER